MNVTLATCAALPGLAPDDRVLLRALRAHGCAAEPAVWEDPHQNWSGASLCIVRSAWDYAYRRDAFLGWARHVNGETDLWNPLPVIEWNTHKRYLVDLAASAVPAVPTRVLGAGTTVDLAALLQEEGWHDVIIKAAVAQTGRYLRRASRTDLPLAQLHLNRFLPHEDMLVQPFMAPVTETGEISIVFIDGVYSHAVRKLAAAGEFRVHDDFGGSVARETPASEELEVAAAAVAAVPHRLLYARVDLVRDGSGSPVVMELELVEPELYFGWAPEAADAFAECILSGFPNRKVGSIS